jgi:hypothetical protein
MRQLADRFAASSSASTRPADPMELISFRKHQKREVPCAIDHGQSRSSSENPKVFDRMRMLEFTDPIKHFTDNAVVSGKVERIKLPSGDFNSINWVHDLGQIISTQD